MPKAKTSSQKKKVAKKAVTRKAAKTATKTAKAAPATKAKKPAKPVNPFAKLLEMKKAKLAERTGEKAQGEVWKQGGQASHTWDHRYTKFAGPRRRAS